MPRTNSAAERCQLLPSPLILRVMLSWKKTQFLLFNFTEVNVILSLSPGLRFCSQMCLSVRITPSLFRIHIPCLSLPDLVPLSFCTRAWESGVFTFLGDSNDCQGGELLFYKVGGAYSSLFPQCHQKFRQEQGKGSLGITFPSLYLKSVIFHLKVLKCVCITSPWLGAARLDVAYKRQCPRCPDSEGRLGLVTLISRALNECSVTCKCQRGAF